MNVPSEEWQKDLISIAAWAIKSLDVRYSYLYAETAKDVLKAPGIAFALETSVVLAIYEASIGKGYIGWRTIEHEKSYPGEEGKNPRRADLAIKEEGVGKNWVYIEVKCYGDSGKYQIGSDIDKLKSIEKRSQRWMLIYRIRPIEGKSSELHKLLRKNFDGALTVTEKTEVSVWTSDKEPGVCEICLAKVA